MDDAWTPLKVLEWTTARFAERGVEGARLEAQLLVAHGLGLTRVELYTHFDKPLAYVVGEQEFWSLPFKVDARVLIPRRDTETLIEVALRVIGDRTRPLAFADIGTGSGPIALALLRELTAARAIAIDLSEDALAVARDNAERNGLSSRIEFRRGDLLAPLAAGERVALMCANLPYVTTTEMAGLAPEVLREPRGALDGGADGLDLVRRLIAAAPAHLEPGAALVLEHGHEQGPAVRALLASPTWRDVETTADLGGRPRVTFGRLA